MPYLTGFAYVFLQLVEDKILTYVRETVAVPGEHRFAGPRLQPAVFKAQPRRLVAACSPLQLPFTPQNRGGLDSGLAKACPSRTDTEGISELQTQSWSTTLDACADQCDARWSHGL